MKVLFLGIQDIMGSINAGGVQCSQRNYVLLGEAVGSDNIYAGIIWNGGTMGQNVKYFSRNETNRDSLIASVFMRRMYKLSEEKKIKQYITEINPDVLFIDNSMIGRILSDVNRNIKKIIFFHNIEKDYSMNRVRKEGLRFFPAYLATYFNEKRAVKYGDKLICLNSRDSEKLERVYGRRADYLLPITFTDRFDSHKLDRRYDEKTLLFVGSNFGPNYDGIKWFVENVMGGLPEYTLLIVGKGFEDVRSELERKNVKVIGTVDCLDDYYYQHYRIVMPIKYGEGMKVKTAEAMMFGMKIYATDEALEGYDVEGLTGIVRCNSKETFINEICKPIEEGNAIIECRDVRSRFLEKYETNHQINLMKEILGV